MSTLDNANKKCNFCGEEIFRELRRCPYCGSLLEIYKENYTKDLTGNGATADAETSNEETTSKSVDFVLVKNPSEESANIAATKNLEESSEIQRVNKTAIKEHVKKSTLSNGLKVFLTIISTVIPGLGQLAGIIISILFMNDEHDEDKRSFGIALLIASLVFFAISCVIFFIILITFFPIRFESFN